MSIQTIVTAGGERLVVLPETEYRALLQTAEDAADRQAVATFQRRLQAGEEELVPDTIVDRVLAGENRVKIWREHRGLTTSALARDAEVGQGFLSQIESGKREGTAETLLKIARILRVGVEDLVEPKGVRVERLIHRRPGLTPTEVAAGATLTLPQTVKLCDGLRRDGRIVARGEPVRFYPPEENA